MCYFNSEAECVRMDPDAGEHAEDVHTHKPPVLHVDGSPWISFPVHLASNGCNMWEMKLTEGLHMLWMHVDGSP